MPPPSSSEDSLHFYPLSQPHRSRQEQVDLLSFLQDTRIPTPLHRQIHVPAEHEIELPPFLQEKGEDVPTTLPHHVSPSAHQELSKLQFLRDEDPDDVHPHQANAPPRLRDEVDLVSFLRENPRGSTSCPTQGSIRWLPSLRQILGLKVNSNKSPTQQLYRGETGSPPPYLNTHKPLPPMPSSYNSLVPSYYYKRNPRPFRHHSPHLLLSFYPNASPIRSSIHRFLRIRIWIDTVNAALDFNPHTLAYQAADLYFENRWGRRDEKQYTGQRQAYGLVGAERANWFRERSGDSLFP